MLHLFGNISKGTYLGCYLNFGVFQCAWVASRLREGRLVFVFVNTLSYLLIFLLHSKHDDESIRAPNKCLNLVKFRGSEDVLSCQLPQQRNQYGRHDTRLAGKKEELRQQSDKGHMQGMDLHRLEYRGISFLQNICTFLLYYLTSYPRRVIVFTAVRTSGLT